MKTERHIVDNRVFLLGLDELYRTAMKRHERDELLRYATETAKVLAISPSNVPIEGYYTEDQQLSDYFRLIRALQQVSKDRETELSKLSSFSRLKQVTTSPIFGPPFDGGNLLSVGKDALAVALRTTFPEWNIQNLTDAAYRCALDSEEFSLVALAALARDPVVLAALRESVVLYAMAVGGSASWDEPEYVWNVDAIIEKRAAKFVATFNELFQETLPQPTAANAKIFWAARTEWKILGRCVHLGFDDSVTPIKHYHWAIDCDENYRPVVKDFWDHDLWTTARYSESLAARH